MWDPEDDEFFDGFVWGLIVSPIGMGGFIVACAICALLLWWL